MNLKVIIKYELYNIKKALIIFYVSIYVLLIFLSIMYRENKVGFAEYVQSGFRGYHGCMELATIIFILVIGFISFKKCFEFYQANGVSRKEQHLGFIASVWIIAAILSFVDNMNAFVFSRVITFRYTSFYEYLGNLAHLNRNATDISNYFLSFLWAMFAYAMFFTIGYSLSLLFYKMKRTWRIIIPVGVPVLLFGLATVDDWFNHATAGYGLRDNVPIAFGMADPNEYYPLVSIITCGIVIIIFSLINQAMIRRTALK